MIGERRESIRQDLIRKKEIQLKFPEEFDMLPNCMYPREVRGDSQ